MDVPTHEQAPIVLLNSKPQRTYIRLSLRMAELVFSLSLLLVIVLTALCAFNALGYDTLEVWLSHRVILCTFRLMNKTNIRMPAKAEPVCYPGMACSSFHGSNNFTAHGAL